MCIVLFFGAIDRPIYAASSQVSSQSLQEKIEQTKEEAIEEAREILDNLINEVRTTTVNLPLASYPEAMKIENKIESNGDFASAFDDLQNKLVSFLERVSA